MLYGAFSFIFWHGVAGGWDHICTYFRYGSVYSPYSLLLAYMFLGAFLLSSLKSRTRKRNGFCRFVVRSVMAAVILRCEVLFCVLLRVLA